MLQQLLRKKSAEQHRHSSLRRSLNAFDLTLMGIGAIIGAGVFVLTGIAAATEAGPAIVISYMIAGMAALFAALSYAELAASIGGAGSAYSYAYAGFGEFIAWLVGWNLILEYIMAVSTVAIGWSGYVCNLLAALHFPLPPAITSGPFEDGIVNLPAVLIIVALTGLLCLSVKLSARFNATIVAIKLATIVVFIVVASRHINLHNLHPFFPFGWSGVVGGAALVFFAYIGFDALSTAVEETINPARNIPIGILSSLIICTIIYIVVSALLTSIAPYYTLNVQSPVADALLRIGSKGAAACIAAGAIAGLTTVILVMFYGLTRICLAISRDGLLPVSFAIISPHTGTPIPIIILLGIIITLIAGLVPIGHAAQLVNIGTLAAFTFVCAGVIILRITQPNMPRPFKAPFSPFTPLAGIIFCLYLMIHLSSVTWWRFCIWSVTGIIIYFLYSQQHSLLNKKSSPPKI